MGVYFDPDFRAGKSDFARAMDVVRRFTWQLEHMKLSPATIRSHKQQIEEARKYIGGINVASTVLPEQKDENL